MLASRSPFRRLALDLLGLEYEVVSADIDEKAIRHSDPMRLTRELSEAKALAVGDCRSDPSIVVAGDAVAVLGSQILEKPADLDQAFEMLSALSGNTFAFVTGVAVYHTGAKRMLSTVQRSDISFRPLIEREIRAYMDTHSVLDFAGAYEEDAVLLFAERVEGSPNFRAALSVADLTLLLRQQGVEV